MTVHLRHDLIIQLDQTNSYLMEKKKHTHRTQPLRYISSLLHTKVKFVNNFFSSYREKMVVKIPSVKLNNGYEMPIFGFGTYNV